MMWQVRLHCFLIRCLEWAFGGRPHSAPDSCDTLKLILMTQPDGIDVMVYNDRPSGFTVLAARGETARKIREHTELMRETP